jgi:heme oxygenase (biliverdin-IX-beta and delta-forming)
LIDTTLSRLSARARLKRATDGVHQRLEARIDAVARLADPASRDDLVRRFACLQLPAGAALNGALGAVEGLDAGARTDRTRFFAPGAAGQADFPRPESRCEALGMLYVLEGSTLGGRHILNSLARQGVNDAALHFLDPYGDQTGPRWRAFLDVLEREVGDDETRMAQAEQGARRAFRHAETILCGETA